MNVGIVTTWFERGAAYVSKQFEEIISTEYKVYIYARAEEYAIGDPNWDRANVTWGKKIDSPFAGKVIHKKDFKKWIDKNDIDIVIFNEQHWFQPLLWCKEWQVKTVAYVDYYTERTIPLFAVYDALICNTKRHFSAFEWHPGASYVPWGTNTTLFKPKVENHKLVHSEYVTFFHSCGWNHDRKGTKFLLRAFNQSKKGKKLIVHSQKDSWDDDIIDVVNTLIADDRLEVINKTVPAPGLYYLADVYLYPTVLEGIGLTIAEALSSGLATVVPDNGPMNEFVSEGENGLLIKLDKCFARNDGYYWPKCLPDVGHLTEIIDYFADHKEVVENMKEKARVWALKDLSYSTNFAQIKTILKETAYKPIDEKLTNSIHAFDNYGMKKLNKYYLKFPLLFSKLKRFLP